MRRHCAGASRILTKRVFQLEPEARKELLRIFYITLSMGTRFVCIARSGIATLRETSDEGIMLEI